MERILEPEIMIGEHEAAEYDALTERYAGIVDEGFTMSVCRLGPVVGAVLDIGTGTGRIPIRIVQKQPHLMLTGIDLSDAMLAKARANADEAGMAERLLFRSADAKDLPFSDASFDMVICHNTLHHFPLPALVLREALRVLKPDGALLVRDLIRPRWPRLYVYTFGLFYDSVMKRQYYDSLRAALTTKEARSLAFHLHDPALNFRIFGCTHWGIEKPHQQANTFFNTPATNPLIKMYIS